LKPSASSAREELIVERDADGIETHGLDAIQIGFGDVVGAPLPPEFFRLRRTQQFFGEVFDFARRLRAAIEVEHVAFHFEPVPEVDAAEQEGLLIAIEELFRVGVDEAVPGDLGGEKRSGDQKEEKAEESGAGSGVLHGPNLLRQTKAFKREMRRTSRSS
jgi:hypothetical protein